MAPRAAQVSTAEAENLGEPDTDEYHDPEDQEAHTSDSGPKESDAATMSEDEVDQEDARASTPVPVPPPKRGRGRPKKKLVSIAASDEEHAPTGPAKSQGPAKRTKRQSKPTMKKSDAAHTAPEKDQLEKELSRIQNQYKALKKAMAAQKHNGGSQQDDDAENESEEEMFDNPNSFSSSVKVVPYTHTEKENRPPLIRVKPQAAHAGKLSKRLSPHAYKALPPVQAHSAHPMEDVHDTPTIHGPTKPGKRSRDDDDDATGAQKRSRNDVQDDSDEEHPEREHGATGEKPMIPQLKEGVVLIPGRRLKASDYEDVARALINRAAHEFEVLVSTQNSLPSSELRFQWAERCWRNACLASQENYAITEGISSIASLRRRPSRIRGHALTIIRSLVVNLFGFKKGTKSSTIAHNRDLYTLLKTDAAFHYKNPHNKTGHTRGKIITETIEAIWFDGLTGPGVIYAAHFNPIPLETLALVLTVIDFCLDEWSSGTFTKAHMWAKLIFERHNAFREVLKTWEAINKDVVLAIRKKMYKHACQHAGLAPPSSMPTLTVEDIARVRQELDGHSGETDSEDDDNGMEE
ncbi:hypothetical protein JR316_0005649 [Psilocybe cubensis]|uniref:Uncharacterized protein n=2 Tax=Psilocybe cubensis TaxID=181762 RepID=A0ACB8H1K3_PSICU|nr:hypothetical protein JR316_0005649 [Psilocybe cubensis]KAH9481129.1 hypothetical protein JR316_0005649 [Psilocybe cubensis]